MIINTEKDEKIRGHQVSNVPFPFTSVSDYEVGWKGIFKIIGIFWKLCSPLSIELVLVLLERNIGFLEMVFFSQASIRAPVGATFVPRTAHLKMIKPRIKTRAGEVIEPMSRY